MVDSEKKERYIGRILVGENYLDFRIARSEKLGR
jgi:hypothetical protein